MLYTQASDPQSFAAQICADQQTHQSTWEQHIRNLRPPDSQQFQGIHTDQAALRYQDYYCEYEIESHTQASQEGRGPEEVTELLRSCKSGC